MVPKSICEKSSGQSVGTKSPPSICPSRTLSVFMFCGEGKRERVVCRVNNQSPCTSYPWVSCITVDSPPSVSTSSETRREVTLPRSITTTFTFTSSTLTTRPFDTPIRDDCVCSVKQNTFTVFYSCNSPHPVMSSLPTTTTQVFSCLLSSHNERSTGGILGSSSPFSGPSTFDETCKTTTLHPLTSNGTSSVSGTVVRTL